MDINTCLTGDRFTHYFYHHEIGECLKLQTYCCKEAEVFVLVIH